MSRQAAPAWRRVTSIYPSTRYLEFVSTDGVSVVPGFSYFGRPARLFQLEPGQSNYLGRLVGSVCWDTMICIYKFVRVTVVLDN